MTDDCWLCDRPPGLISPTMQQTLCTCGFELRTHGYGHPHALAVVGCAAFRAALPLPPPQPETDAQVALF